MPRGEERKTSLHFVARVQSGWKAFVEYHMATFTHRETDADGGREVSRLKSPGVELDQ